MKRIFLIIIVLILTGMPAFAQNSSEQSSAESLSSILMSLKNSAAELRAKNQWIKRQIDQTQKNIDALSAQLKNVGGDIQQVDSVEENLQLEVSSKSEAARLMKERISRMNEDIAQLVKDQAAWENKLQNRQQSKKEILLKTAATQKEVDEYKAKISNFQNRVVDVSIIEEQNSVSEEILQTQKNIMVLEKQLASLQGRKIDPQTQAGDLKKQKEILVSRFDGLSIEQKAVVEEKSDREKKYNDLEQAHKEQIALIEQDITAKQSKKIELEAILQKAQERLKEKDVSLKQTVADVERLKGSLEILAKDHRQLSLEFEVTEKKLRSLEN